jgi:hypothetical protein
VKRTGPVYMLKLVLLNPSHMHMLHGVVHSTWDALSDRRRYTRYVEKGNTREPMAVDERVG